MVEVIDGLESAGIDVWVEGGWGIDALLGEQTRPHYDLDVFIRADDIEAAMRVTGGLGFSLMTDELPQGFVVRDKADRRIDFHPVVSEVMVVRFRRLTAAVNGCSLHLES